MNLGKQGSRGFEVTYSVRAPSAKLEANYSFYAPTFADNLGAYTVPGHPDQFMGAPAHRVHARGTVWVWDRIGISPSVLVLGPHFTRGPDDPASTPGNTPNRHRDPDAGAGEPVHLQRQPGGTPGLSLGLGIYNIFGAKYQYVHISTSATPSPTTRRRSRASTARSCCASRTSTSSLIGPRAACGSPGRAARSCPRP